MFLEERLEKILKIVSEKDRLTVKEASSLLGVSNDTIRRDIIKLVKNNLVMRTHGGIVSKSNILFDPALEERVIEHKEEKELIATQASSMINDSEVIILNAGTTTERIVKYLSNVKNLIILTNALNIAINTIRYSNIETIIIGGNVRKGNLSIIGPDSINMIKNYHAEKLFIGISAISIERGLMTPNRMEAEINSELLKIAKKVIVVADSS
ncbi:MAG: DeoR/GlpR family DNA-binding transcription regulator, partial [Actinobacteria bacterium]|nr:DeoR/GlpR family DNA-binding transcription regulator [Actinomycetota bacterium]